MNRAILNADQYYRNITFLDQCVLAGRIDILFEYGATFVEYATLVSRDAEDLLVLVLILK